MLNESLCECTIETVVISYRKFYASSDFYTCVAAIQTHRFLTTLIFQFLCTKIIDMHGFRKMPKTYKVCEAIET